MSIDDFRAKHSLRAYFWDLFNFGRLFGDFLLVPFNMGGPLLGILRWSAMPSGHIECETYPFLSAPIGSILLAASAGR